MDFVWNIFKGAANFFVDGQHAITKRLGVGLIVMGLAFMIDDQVGITFFYATDKKIEQAQRLTTILSSDSIDTATRNQLKVLQLSILKRKGFISQSWDFIRSAINSRTNQTASTNPTSIIDVRLNIFLHVLSSSWLLLIVTAVGFVGLLLQKRVGGYEIAGIVLLLAVIVAMVTLFAFAFSFIPVLFGNPSYNYLLNAVLHFLLMILVIRVASKWTQTNS